MKDVGVVLLALVVLPLSAWSQISPEAAERLLLLANQTRSAHGLGMLAWDPALARAAAAPCRRMAEMGAISHQFEGEEELSQRAAHGGAHFGLVEENVAVAGSADRIHNAWMNSPGHRANLLNMRVDRVGIAVIVVRGSFYAVADYSHGVPQLSREEAEAKIGNLLTQSGLERLDRAADARMACEQDHVRAKLHGETPTGIFRWEDADPEHLPAELRKLLSRGNYARAAVGNCRVEGSPFTVYRFAVLLYPAQVVGK